MEINRNFCNKINLYIIWSVILELVVRENPQEKFKIKWTEIIYVEVESELHEK